MDYQFLYSIFEGFRRVATGRAPTRQYRSARCTWLTDPGVFLTARDSRPELVAEVAEFGLKLEHFAVFNHARDTITGPLSSSTARARSGGRLDSSV